MAPAQGFYQSTPPQEIGWGELQEMQQKGYRFRQAKDLDKIFAKNLAKETVTDPSGKVVTRAGDLDQAGFYRDAANMGIGADQFGEGLKLYLAQKRGEAEAVATDRGMQSMGVGQPVQSRNRASVGEPPINVTPAGENTGGAPGQTAESSGPSNPLVPAKAPEASPLTSEKLRAWFDQTKASKVPAAGQDPEAPAAEDPEAAKARLAQFLGMKAGGAPGTMDLGQSRIEAAPEGPRPSPTLTLPELPPQPQGSISQAPDTRTHFQAVEDSAIASGGAALGIQAPGLPKLESDQAKITRIEDYARNGLIPQESLMRDARGRVVLNEAAEAGLRQALAADWDQRIRSVGPPPSFEQFLKPRGDGSGVPDFVTANAAFSAAMRDWQGKVQALPAQFAREGSELFGTQFNQDMTGQQNARANESQGWTRSGRVSVEQEGLDPNKVSPDAARDLVARKNLLESTDKMVTERKNELMGVSGSRAQVAAVAAVLNNLARIEGANTIAGSERIEQLLQTRPNVWAEFQQRGPKAAAEALVRSAGANPQEAYSAIRGFIDDTKRDGIIANEFRAGQTTAVRKKEEAKLTPGKLREALGGKAPPTITDEAAYNALPAGAKYMDSKGRLHTKGGR